MDDDAQRSSDGEHEHGLAARFEVERRRLVASNELTAALSSAYTRAEVAHAVFERGLAVLGADAGALAIVDPRVPGTVELVEQFGYSKPVIDPWRRFPLSLETPVCEAIRSGEPVWVATSSDALARYPGWAPAVVSGPDRAWAALPLTIRDRTFGALALTYYEARAFDADYQQVLRSVSERCAQALDRGQALDDARRRAAELEAVLAAVPAAVCITRDPEARFIEVNPAGREMFGLRPDANASLNRDPSDPQPFAVFRDGRQVPVDELPMQAAARFGREVRDLEIDVLRSDGVLVHVIANARPIVDSEGARRGAVGTFTDITERKRDADALRLADRNKAEFLAVLSHELRNPLAPIRNSLLLLERVAPDSPEAARAREVLHRQADHLTRLVDDLLDINRITHGKIELKRTRLDPRDVALASVDDQRTLFEQRGIALRTSLAPEPTSVYADADRLSQMIGNLLHNALKFTPPGGSVQVDVQREGEQCRISVRDTGEGIHTDDLARIFDPFVQADHLRHGAHGGMGLGLALVRDLAKLHGGSVRASSEGLGHGTEVTILLPLDARPIPDAAVREAPAMGAGLDVVIIEDNQDAGTSLADLLSFFGHRARVAITATAGLDLVRTTSPDLLISDIGLPDLSGYEVVRAVRGMALARPLFAIALTGFAQPEDRARALEAGFDAHLRKPPPLEELEALLARAVSMKRGR